MDQVPDDRELLSTQRVNALIVGTDATTSAVIAALRPSLAEPVFTVRVGEPLPPSDQGGSLILLDVCRFTPAEQLRLLEWLDENARGTQVISTSSRSLTEVIAAGEFHAVLYYRLNVVYIDMTAVAS
jgi:hypothetical protein